jgi:hypothetical protein
MPGTNTNRPPYSCEQPEGNGSIERIFCTLKVRNLVELRTALMESRDRYNHQWIIESTKLSAHQFKHDAIFSLKQRSQRDSTGPIYSRRIVHPVRSDTPQWPLTIGS